MTVDIVIVNWNTGNYLRECLLSIARTDRSLMSVGKVVVVDNGSSDDSALDLELPGLRLEVVQNACNRGFAAACNQGAALCSSDYLLFLNPDTRLFPHTLRTVGEFLNTKVAEKIGICGARIVDDQGQSGISASRFPTLRIFVGKMTGLSGLLPTLFPPHHLRPEETVRSRHVDQVIGAFFLVGRPLFDELDGFDERYFLYFEEVDFALRASLRGRPSYLVSAARVYHAGNVSTNQARGRRLSYSLSSRTLFAFRHWPRWKASLLLALSLSVEPTARLVTAALRRSGSDLRDIVVGYWCFLRWLLESVKGRRKPPTGTPLRGDHRHRSESSLRKSIGNGSPAGTPSPTPLHWPTRPTTPRRILDVAFGIVALALISPLMAVLALLVRTTSRGPALFRQKRVGEGGREFTLYKFRTMRVGSAGPEVTSSDDPRVTAVGQVLRRLSLDELPQLLNVVRGDMTLVGPRPETLELARRYAPECMWVLRHRPGLTGPVQLQSRELAAVIKGESDPETYYLQVLVPRRVTLDAEFLAEPTLSNTVRLITRTVRYVTSTGPGGTSAEQVAPPTPEELPQDGIAATGALSGSEVTKGRWSS